MNYLLNNAIFLLQTLFGLICIFLLYEYCKKVKSYEFHALAQKIAFNDKMAHFNFSLLYFNDFYRHFNHALLFLLVILFFEFLKIDDIYLVHLINFIFIFVGYLYIIEKKYMHELSRQTMLKILLTAFAVINLFFSSWKNIILPQSIHIQHHLLYIHLMTVAASFSFVVAILMHSAVMLSLKTALKNVMHQDSAKNTNMPSFFFKRDDFPSIEAMESIFLKRLDYLLWVLSSVLMTGVILILDLHANALQGDQIIKNTQTHINYLPFYFKLSFSFLLWAGILALKIYHRRYGLAISKIWYTSLILNCLWLLSYGFSHFWF